VEHSGNQVGRVAALVVDGLKQLPGFFDGGCVALVDGTLGAESVNVANGLARDFLVGEKDGVQGLVLSAGRDVAVACEVGEEEWADSRVSSCDRRCRNAHEHDT
jgi:hypothetical protein